MTANQQPIQAVVVSQSTPSPNQQQMQLALFDAAGTPVLVTAATMKLTGYTIAGAAAALSDTDTLNVALGKLEKRIDILEP